MYKFSPMFSPEWEAERAEFYAGLFAGGEEQAPPFDEKWTAEQRVYFEDIWSRQKDRWPVRYGASLPRQGDPEKIIAALEGLVTRLIAAHRMMGDVLPPGAAGRNELSEVISDAGTFISHFSEMLSPYGRPLDLRLKVVQRGAGAARDSYAIRRRELAIGAEIGQRVMEGTKLDSVLHDILQKLGCSLTYSKSCYREWQHWAEVRADL